MTLNNNRAPLLSNIKLYAPFHNHMWIQTGVTVRKRLSWVLTSVTLTFDLWPWPFAWTSLLSLVITPENFVMIQWWEHSQKGVTDRQTDGRTKRSVLRAAWSQLKISAVAIVSKSPNSFQYHWMNYVHTDKLMYVEVREPGCVRSDRFTYMHTQIAQHQISIYIGIRIQKSDMPMSLFGVRYCFKQCCLICLNSRLLFGCRDISLELGGQIGRGHQSMNVFVDH